GAGGTSAVVAQFSTEGVQHGDDKLWIRVAGPYAAGVSIGWSKFDHPAAAAIRRRSGGDRAGVTMGHLFPEWSCPCPARSSTPPTPRPLSAPIRRPCAPATPCISPARF